MFDYLDIVKENDSYRVRLEHDDSGEKPYDESAVPILAHYWRGSGYRFEAVNDAGKEFEDLISELYNRFDNHEEVIERFLKIFLGAYSVEWDSSQEARYLAFDTAAWRAHVGLTDEWLDAHTMERGKLAEGSLTEIMAWANGEVYGWILERRLTTYTTYKDPTTGETVRETESEDWEQVDSCWGYYGDKYAREVATEEFDRVTKE